MSDEEMTEREPMTLIIHDELRIKQAVKAQDLLKCLWDYDQKLRELAKYSNDEGAEKARELLYEYLNENNISFDELYA